MAEHHTDPSPHARNLTGWKRQKPDARDYVFQPPQRLLEVPLPASFDMNNPPLAAPFNPSLNQQSLGACGPFTLVENIIFDLLKSVGSAVKPSPMFSYYVTRVMQDTVGQDSGVDNRTMLKALKKYGWCLESTWPYIISKFTQQPPAAAYTEALKTADQIIYQAVPQDLASMKTCLISTGRPFIYGFTVYSSMLTGAVDQTGDVPDPSQGDSVEGGHDVLIVGYDDATQRWKFKNHWYNGNKPWGNGGYGTISYKYSIDPNIAGDFWTVVNAAGTQPSPQPVPTPTPTPTPTPVPVPPGPSPIPGTLATVVTWLFAQLDKMYPQYAPLFDMVKLWILALIGKQKSGRMMATATVSSVSELQVIVDAIFAQLIASAAGNVLEVWALQFAQKWIDDLINRIIPPTP